MRRFPPDHYISGIRSGDRLVLSRAITLVESQLESDQELALAVLEQVLPQTGQSIRVGITGVPGVGKSTFIEAFGKYLTGAGKKVAVLAIDPTSQRSHGSILGDKTRMETLSMDPLAYIRPTPSGGSLGGVANKTRETMLLCEAAGFEVILIETVGVGQSETLVHGMVDFFLLLMLAGAGDELQGMKRGIMELADAIAITKADGDNANAAEHARLDYQNALHLFPPAATGWIPPVLTCSALQNQGIVDLWQIITDHQRLLMENGYRDQNRQQQNLDWLHSTVRQRLENRFYAQPGMRAKLTEIEDAVRNGEILPLQGARRLMNFSP
ncbi:methylmalonyl Co-A mutase-associated GTPase MeaB [Larkinella terrae]|uniref:Methylmalonyl Co-A mutase-associated GTPase MeaB n=1 Tax=Larkinella terrae TaxID=2025311 RepID=A0A7K0EKM3_9BACT|nr:methylmalonyl Co-A mutase-associated GTPase MeaB [Larkinella terrae]MRS62335.1 methylmalonyl Co-A mutase-associated GTPase MeaB [Larkinella terrae]